MKRTLLLTAALVMLTLVSGYSQSKIGFTAGFNLNNARIDIRNDEEPETAFKPGFHFGIVSVTELSESIDLRSSLLFNSKGVSSGDVEGDDYDRIAFNYVELPVNLVFNLDEGFNLFAGPYLGVGVGGKNKFKFDGEKGEIDLVPSANEVDYNDFLADEAPFRRIDYGFNVGVGYSLDQMMINLGYSHGLSNLNVDVTNVPFTGDVSADDNKFFNQVVSLSLIYFLD